MTTKETIFELIRIFTKESVSEESVIVNDLGMDSVAVFSLIGEIEAAFGIRLMNRRLRKIRTVGELIALVEEKL